MPDGTTIEFAPFPKLARLYRSVVVTEKIDGTNAAVGVTEDGDVYAQSRKRLIYPGDDNFGFAAWVEAHRDELSGGLGVGLHFGEWWGQGIQRNYGLEERRFSLFNVARWTDDLARPECCDVVPTLATFDTLNTGEINGCLAALDACGSEAAPGFMEPEGIVVFHTHSNKGFKVTFDDEHKGAECNLIR